MADSGSAWIFSLNTLTLRSVAHPLPHQVNCLVALRGNTFFSIVDLMSGFYNIPMCNEDKNYSAFKTSVSQYEYNRMLQQSSFIYVHDFEHLW